MRVLNSPSPRDKPAGRPLVEALCARGFDPWLDEWEIRDGHDFVAHINDGLDKCEAGIIVFTSNAEASKWVNAEVSFLIYGRVHGGKPLVPVVLDTDAKIPALLRMLVRRRIDEVDAIAEALRHRGTPRPAPLPEHGQVNRVVITLQRQAGGAIRA